jgi:hypothetical protein
LAALLNGVIFDFPEISSFKYFKVIAKNDKMTPEKIYMNSISIFLVTVITRDFHLNIRNVKGIYKIIKFRKRRRLLFYDSWK